MSTILMVPTHLDALVLTQDRNVVGAFADFSLLPYNNGSRDVNFNTANVSESIVSHPFQDVNLRLRAGLHLHWALPGGLTKTQSNGEFPRVPNRWLITRRIPGHTDIQWVVESDYLYPDGQGGSSGSVTVPFAPDRSQNETHPYRYMGRSMAYSDWQNDDTTGNQYLAGLSAVGYGEPTFAAFYPNCHSVFGFYDATISETIPTGLQYDILGWYEDPNQDALRTWIAAFNADFQLKNGRVPTAQETLEGVEAAFGWTFSLADDGGAFPDQIVCYGRLTFDAGGAPRENPALTEANTSPVAVGNTGTEALSAYVAQTIDPAHKTTLEDQLEALQMGSVLGTHVLDVGPNFEEARHQKQFIAATAGSLWTIVAPASSQTDDQATLPDELAERLNIVNLLQQDYDRALAEIDSMRRRIFADWYKYMLSAYPPRYSRDELTDPDKTRYFIQQRSLVNLQRKIESTGTLELQTADDGSIVSAAGSPANSRAARLSDAVNQLRSGMTDSDTQLRLSPAARYWRPTDPVVLLTGDDVAPSSRYDADGENAFLPCQPCVGIQGSTLIPNNLPLIQQQFNTIAASATPTQAGFNSWTQEPWHAILLQWEVELFPTQAGSNLCSPNREYADDFITGSYELDTGAVDLSLQPGKGAVMSGANVYTGTSILSRYAKNQLTTQGTTYLLEQTAMLDAFYAAYPNVAHTAEGLLGAMGELEEWYELTYFGENADAQALAADPVFTTIRALSVLGTTHVLSQSLGGFHETLIMQKQTLQLTIADPLGYADAQAFASQVRDAVADQNRTAPQPLSDFNPIRSGVLKFGRLRLIDNFGRFKDIACDDVCASEPLTLSGSSRIVNLPPRLAQPARINFRWLAATDGLMEMNAHPASSPICGWVVANLLDRSLMIYDADGHALGSITPNTAMPWQPAPGDPSPLNVSLISNSHLKKMVAWIIDQGSEFLQNFLAAIENAFENIAPENPAQDQGLALLMSRPLALVRASVGLQLLGLPAIHEGWNRFRQDMQRTTRETDAFPRVQFPVRIGDYRQYNDGLVGYWIERGDGYEDNIFYAPQSDSIIDPHIQTHSAEPMNIPMALDDAPRFLSMLFDPRGLVHATAAIVPTKTIDIPPAQYQDALGAMEISFLTTPILTDRNQLQVIIPDTAGGSWSWVEKQRNGWNQVDAFGIVRKQAFTDAFGHEQADIIWVALGSCGWIDVTDPVLDIATVTAKDQRTEGLPEGLLDRQDPIEAILLRSYIGTPSTRADFSGQKRITEGWLKLRRAQRSQQVGSSDE